MPIAKEKEIFMQMQNTLVLLEQEIKTDIKKFDAWKQFSPNDVIAEKTKNYHYSQMTAKMNTIKKELVTLLYHDRQVKLLNEKLNKNESLINLRENKSVLRRLETPVKSSMKDLENWEQIFVENDANLFKIKKRHGSFREKIHNRRIVSSTIDALLEYPLAGKKQEELYKSADCIHFDSKPKIVGVVLKKPKE